MSVFVLPDRTMRMKFCFSLRGNCLRRGARRRIGQNVHESFVHDKGNGRAGRDANGVGDATLEKAGNALGPPHAPERFRQSGIVASDGLETSIGHEFQGIGPLLHP